MIPAVNSNQTFGANYSFKILKNIKLSALYDGVSDVCQSNGKVFIQKGGNKYSPKENEVVIDRLERGGSEIIVHIRDAAQKISQNLNNALIDLGVKLCTKV